MNLDQDLQSVLKPLREGRHNAAFKAAKSAMRRHKTHPAFANIAGIALCGMDRHREGLPFFKKALALDPGFDDARRNMVQTLISLNQPDLALVQIRRLLADNPNDAGAWYLKAQACANAGQIADGEDAASRAIGLDPKQVRSYMLRALLRDKLAMIADAIADYETVLRLDPDNVQALTSISLPLARQTRTKEALAAVSRAVEIDPANPAAKIRLAMQLTEMGRREDAIRTFHTVLTQNPFNPEAIEQLAQLQSPDQNAALLPMARAALKQASRSGEDRASLNFALARMSQQTGSLSEAEQHLAVANRCMAAVHPYDSSEDDRLSKTILSGFPIPGDHVPPTDADGPRPIYVVGLPRSGTTLAEAILGAHPGVTALGERAVTGSLIYPLLRDGLPFDPDDFAATDTARLPALPPETIAYVDKMPENYRLIGFLKSAYPQCRIVNLRRDPRDVALSMWRGHFSGTALAYTYDLTAMAHRFNLYAREMAHWHKLYPGQIFDLQYEDMAADVETASRNLADFCDLDWTAGMARPDLNAEQVLTLSAGQLRQPVHTRSIGKWRQHEIMLAPFIKDLDPDLWPGIA